MSQRILSLTFYLLRTVILSLAGLLYILLASVFYLILFDPRQQTPDIEYYILVIGLFGAVLTFLITLTVAARANQAVHFPFLVRLPSRVEYLSSTLAASLFFSFFLQGFVAVLALIANGPDLSLSQLLTIPPLWIATNLLFAVLALHATDLVAVGWSRVYLFGLLAVLLYVQSILDTLVNWMSGLLDRISAYILNLGFTGFAEAISNLSDWLLSSGGDALSTFAGLLFWPFTAIADAAIAGQFNQLQALAPAMLLLYATVLFLLAADLFATKDLFLSE
jgi:uncharacterized membrane protein YciS (DUF1049 family)